MNKKSIIILVSSFCILIILFLLWQFVIGFKLSVKSEIKNIIKNSSDISMYVVDNQGEMFKIDNEEDVNDILNIINIAKVKKSISSWIGGAYRLVFINNKNNKTIKIVIHPKQITISNKTYDFLNDNDNTYQKIDNILKNHIENIHKFKC